MRDSLPILLFILCAAGPVQADEWLTYRHDARRTGASTGTAAIERPAVQWRTYLGGRLSQNQALDYDVDGDGRNEILYVSGGRVIAKKAQTDVIVWESDILGVDQLVGLVDLDEDGQLELGVRYTWPTPSRVFFLSPLTGTLVWTAPDDVIFYSGVARIGDVDGDGHQDLVLGAGPCGRPPAGFAPSPPHAVAYSFCDATGCDFARARELWRLSAAGNCGYIADLAELDGDPTPEVLLSSSYDVAYVFDGATGVQEGTLTASVPRAFNRSATRMLAADVDGDMVDEVVTVTNVFAESGGSRRIGVYQYSAGAYTIAWEALAADHVNDFLAFDDTGSLQDLDGNGTLDVAYSLFDSASGVTTLHVVRGADGTSQASTTGLSLAGVADLDGDGRGEILGSSATGEVVALSFTGAALTERWRLPGVNVIKYMDFARLPTTRSAAVVFTMQLDTDPAAELVLSVEDVQGRVIGLRAYDADGVTPSLIASYDAPTGYTLLSWFLTGSVTRGFDQVAVTRSDGYLLVLDQSFAVTNRFSSAEFSTPGMRVGGYQMGGPGIQPTPLITTSSAGPTVLAIDSRGVLMQLNASAADVSSPPSVRTELAGVEWPLVTDLDGDGGRDLVVVEGVDLVARDLVVGTERWRAPNATLRYGTAAGGNQGSLLGGPMAARLSATGMDIVLERVPVDAVGPLYQAEAFSGVDGSSLWSTPTTRMGWGPQNYAASAIADITGDGVDDLISSAMNIRTHTGTTGALLLQGGSQSIRAEPLIADLDGDTDLDAFVHGGWFQNFSVDLQTMASLGIDPDMAKVNVNGYGALVQCAGSPAVVAGDQSGGELFAVQALAGTYNVLAQRVVAGGMAYDIGAVPMGVVPGNVSSVTSVADLTGRSQPAVLVGSSDGHLYALDPCTLALIWSLNLRYPVGEPVVGDMTGDGTDEILVSVADGFLYGLTGAAYPSPEPVLDLDASVPGTVDVDQVDSTDQLIASWTAVPGATSYEMGVITAAGTALTTPPFTDVGNVVQAAATGLPLRLGGRYVVAVRALGPAGSSGEALSDGVAIADLLPPTVSVTPMPGVFWPGSSSPSTTIGIVMTDPWGLASYTATVLDSAGTLVTSLGGGPITGAGSRVDLTWDGTDAAGLVQPMGVYTVDVRVIDVAGHEGVGMTLVTLQPPGSADAGPTGDAGTPSPGDPGCACSAAGARGPFAPGWFLVCFVGAALLARRRHAK